ncbi:MULTISPECIES: type II toxin-antitoxin system Phd/YefM family antitoxin [Methylobacterium]|uniref:Antitoxin n=1 Tax=Methylobacterium thuringiense TaxID=1003091 RepID=A0ABQ4TR83_9HYPH|nr:MULTISPECIES: type II toxin-antitoxin system prevent-host-death family antitoxin [Methylobacterium]TXN23704.1 type II toxin-antitoxin system prevent-host-death family antitoxin [Methylobacterium sp. WL9]GJE56150.1 hypothetical protein EKPJFOCH_2649 [Methylobacterium thuringiense]
MREVQATEADWSDLLDEVEKGETVVITREGRPVARIVPESRPARSRAEVLRDIEAFRRRMPRVTQDEISAWRHEGHKR